MLTLRSFFIYRPCDKLYIGIISGGQNALEGHGSRLGLCNILVIDDWLFLTIIVMSFIHYVFCDHFSCDSIRDSSFVLHLPLL